MKDILLVLFTFFCLSSYAQNDFQKGFLITNSGDTLHALIKKEVWINNPTQLEFKSSESVDIQTRTIDQVREFGVPEHYHYMRVDVRMDRSDSDYSKLSNDRNPDFQEERVFLQSLVEGAANLYFYREGGLERFFYSVEGSDPEQLIFKKYNTAENKVGINSRYKQQLWQDVKCPSATINSFKNLDYRRGELVRYFVNYNECTSSNYENFTQRKDTDFFNVKVKVGAGISALKIDQGKFGNMVEGQLQTNLRLGMEAEYFFPFLNRKWSFFIEPTYYKFKSGDEGVAYFTIANVPSNPNATYARVDAYFEIDYAAIEIPLAFRYYVLTKENSNFFLNGGVAVEKILNSSTKATRIDGSDLNRKFDLKDAGAASLLFGLGYSFKSFSIESRYYIGRSYKTPQWKVGHSNNFTLSLGYRIF
ncbi:outer membrane beta-barrel protein [Salegentibacter sp. F188]|uniref:Outer membrane beta-barrel protein n=1 Tax=Autumnicola patrickiae TaxID=3075591 RepID=A0ABU3E0L0_9FLAO|nr:outer membrane beta-barrel protein [Salegentibacter sp. F188]MDT0689428.1 outer membrane beta-barrel protein [Salegentibacter sp. F188]